MDANTTQRLGFPEPQQPVMDRGVRPTIQHEPDLAIPELGRVLQHDQRFLEVRDKAYGSSWRRRGGIGAFMMLARKWDRLEAVVSQSFSIGPQGAPTERYDIFAHAVRNPMVLNDIRDLRRYLALVEAHLFATKAIQELDDPKEP